MKKIMLIVVAVVAICTTSCEQCKECKVAGSSDTPEELCGDELEDAENSGSFECE